MGLFNSGISSYDANSVLARVKDICQVWTDSGVETNISENIQVSRWSKLVWNASFNTVSVASGGNDTRQMLDSPKCTELIRKMMVEVFTAGKVVTGSNLTSLNGQTTPEGVIKSTDAHPKSVSPSMLMDYRAKRPLEYEVILRNPIELAKKHSVEVPHLETVYALLTMIERGYMQ
ncbi:hypothetical protein FBU59_004018 [Linderina macrospora]|uniref:Uncharacterized protein n=1 Tax=Linderina macrospora TaxID=4868 RepID=A0ACC1J6W6_9FUNG|nr:hypothetical protein FBU59_004018 [Linderina macrospora]